MTMGLLCGCICGEYVIYCGLCCGAVVLFACCLVLHVLYSPRLLDFVTVSILQVCEAGGKKFRQPIFLPFST